MQSLTPQMGYEWIFVVLEILKQRGNSNNDSNSLVEDNKNSSYQKGIPILLDCWSKDDARKSLLGGLLHLGSWSWSKSLFYVFHISTLLPNREAIISFNVRVARVSVKEAQPTPSFGYVPDSIYNIVVELTDHG